MTKTGHGAGESDACVDEILGSVKTIAMVGASADETKPSHHVLRFLIDAGYEMIPVNPRPDLTEILGLKVYPSLRSIDRPVDMVDVFRPSEELAGIASEAVEIGATVLWAQLGVRDDEAARIAEAGGLKVVMDRCPKIELLRASRETNRDRGTRAISASGSSFFQATCGFTWPAGPLDTTW
jgi:predicted CoA-binding protein